MGGGGGGGGCVVKGKRACVRREGAIVGLVVRRLGDAVSELRAKLRPPISPLPHILFSPVTCAPPELQLSATMSAAGMDAGAAGGPNSVYEALERYHWDDDVEFQAGLSAILGSNSSPEQAAELALRARCFYYARYGSREGRGGLSQEARLTL